MIDQKIVMVEGRAIMRDLMMELSMQTYTRELAQIGRFFDSNAEAVFNIISHYYVVELSHGRDSNYGIVMNKIHDLVTRELCRYFPMMSAVDITQAEQLFLRVIENGYRARVPQNLGEWDRCSIKVLAMDTHAVVCTRQTTEPITPAAAGGIFVHPINTGEYRHAG